MNAGASTLELMLFGTFDLCVDGVFLSSFRSAKSKMLLAFLTLHTGQAVTTGVIADAVFPDSQAQDPHEVIKKTVQDIRRVLGAEAYRLHSPAPRKLALDLEGAMVDWKVFHAAFQEGGMEALQHAVTVHSRPFLEMETAPWVLAERTRCLKLRQSALEMLFRQAMNGEDTVAAATTLSRQLAFGTPFLVLKEALWRELFQILLQRQEFGLLHFQYNQLKTFLEHTAGRMCEPETQTLYQQIPKAVLLRITQRKEPKKKGTLPASVRLPTFPFALLGREQEKRELKEAFKRARLVTIVGIGGVGKTRLAVEAAHESADFEGEVGFLDLTPCSGANLLQAVTATLGVQENAGTSLYHSLRAFLSLKPLLLVFDNCEHLVDAAATLCADLMRDCPNLRLLATSRETLRVDGEQVLSLHPLVMPAFVFSEASSALEACREAAAVRLFVERAGAVRPYFQLTTQNVFLVIELCRLVDCLPLGIEMIASQTAVVSLKRIAEDLSDCILRLEHRKRGIEPRHQTLAAALGWSYSILNSAEQTLLRRLSVFVGGWTLEGAEQVCSDQTLPVRGISRLLSDLASKSLIVFIDSQVDAVAGAENDALRYHFLDTVRIYAGEQLRLEAEREVLQRRHLDYFVSCVEEAERQFSGKHQKQWLERIDSEYTNIRQALTLSLDTNVEAGLRLGYGLGRYWEIRGHFGEGRDWCFALLAKTQSTDTSFERARLVETAGWLCNILSEFEKAAGLLEESLRIFREQGASVNASTTLIRLGLVRINLGDNEGARALFEESLAMRRAMGDKRLIAIALLNMGIVISSLAEYQQARLVYEECLSLLQEVGDRRITATCLSSLGNLAAMQSDFLQAAALYRDSIRVQRDMGDKYMLRFTLCQSGDVAFYLEDWQTARASYAECLELSQAAQVPFHMAQTVEGLANVAAKQGQWERSGTLWGAAEVLRSTHHYDLSASDQERHDQLIVIAVANAGKEGIENALNTGRCLSREAAVAFALAPAGLL